VNDAPKVAETIAAQSGKMEESFSLALNLGLMVDMDGEQAITYSATFSNGNALPAWLTFDAATRTVSGTPGSTDADTYTIHVTGAEPDGTKSTTSFTTITVIDGSTIVGTEGADLIDGIAYSVMPITTIQGDLVGAKGGNDTVYGLPGADLIKGGAGLDILDGKAGNNVLDGGLDQDQFFGGTGHDVL
jgi:Ca2+-binding RTX toxin-like protein